MSTLVRPLSRARLLAAALAAGWMTSAAAQAPIQPGPPAAHPTKPAARPAPKPAAGKAVPTQAIRPAASADATPAAPGRRDVDLAYGAYQRGYYLTAFALATRRVDEQKDVKAMTLLGELYANGLGIERDDKKAAEWYRLAADRGDREAMLALAMFNLGGRIGSVNREQGAKLLAAAAKLGQPAATYDLALLYLEGQLFPQDFTRAAELFRAASQAGNPEAQYALATLYKDGRGVPPDIQQATRLMGEAAKADFLDAEVEYAIALFNGTGTGKDEARAAELFRKAAIRGSPIAQNRLARIYAFSKAVPAADPVQAIKWHLIAKSGGNSDLYLDDYMQKQTPENRAAGEQAAKPWLDVIAQSRS